MKKFILLLLPILLIFAAFKNSNSITITGTVTDDTGSPVAGATITVLKTKKGTSTNANGKYKLTDVDPQATLCVSAVTIESKCIKNNGKTEVNFSVVRSAMELSSVVVTSVSGVRRQSRELGYATTTISGSTINQAFNGRVSSVSVTPIAAGDDEDGNTEEYGNISENAFHKVTDDPLSTFSIDVDAASYSNVRRYLNENQLPPAGAVRTEEMINYFKYEYPQPAGKDPFSINTEMSDCPWNKDNKLVLIGLQGKNIPTENLPASNLIFLIDVSGSMMSENKLPLVKASLKMLTDQLREKDRISIVVYAGNAGLVLPATSGSDKTKIKNAIDKLEAGGSTAGGAGIRLAYKTAQDNLIKGGNNRVILCTDGDFNVGASSDDEMVRLIEGERNKGVFLTVLGYGMGNYKDSKMQQLADKGNGNHAYIDGIAEAKKVLVNEFGGTLFTIAKDVKLQLEFNPVQVAGYRLIGYENRMLAKEDFNDDKKDAGELGSGHTVTAIYEIIPAGVKSSFLKDVNALKYQKRLKRRGIKGGDEVLTVSFRYKSPDKDVSELITHAVENKTVPLATATDNFRFAASVAGFAMMLRNSSFKGSTSYAAILAQANASLGEDTEGYRKEFVSLVKKAEVLVSSKAAVK